MRHLTPSAALAATAAAALLLLLLATPGSAELRKGGEKLVRGVYIFRLKYEPAATYRGGVVGYDATQVQQSSMGSTKLNVNSAAVVAYAAFLDAQSASVAATANVAAVDMITSYNLVFAGAAVLVTSAQQLAALRHDRRVVSVERVQWVQAFTFSTPRFLGLEANIDGSGGAWDQLGGPSTAGEGVSICVIDSGIEPEHPSFSDWRDSSANIGPAAYAVPSKALYSGSCPVEEDFPAGTCNNKLIGCQSFAKGYIAVFGGIPEGDVNSCRDGSGHGTHVAATAGGNRVGVNGLDKVLISGMAPRARLAMYKALWGEAGRGTTVDIVEAIEKTIADGCDVVNLSLGGPRNSCADIFSVAIMHAAAAGISVVMAAGNSGPNTGTVSNYFPYATVVAASTHSPQSTAVVNANGKRYVGAAFYQTTVGPARLLLADAAALPSDDRSNATKCFNGTLDPAQVAGTIVVCDRGSITSADKAKEVKRAGGIGMILVNVPGEAKDVTAQILVVPHVHLKGEYRRSLRSYAAAPTASAQLLPATFNYNVRAPQMADFSSRGPAAVAKGAFLTPDVTAPGVGVYAPVSRKVSGTDYSLYSGTSMASPHVAGLAALIRQRYPSWSPMAVKSALMTTTYQQTKTGGPKLPFCKPFDCGAGHVDPPQMLNPGLIFESSYEDWAKSLCRSNIEDGLPADVSKRYCRLCPASVPSGQPNPCDAANLNLPSISLPSLAEGVPTVLYRTVTSVLNTTASFSGTSSVDQPNTKVMKVTSIAPLKFTLKPGESQLLRVEVMAQGGASTAGWLFGSINWRSDQGTNTRIPLAAKVSLLDSPFEVSPSVASIKSGSTFKYQLTPGVTGRLQLSHTSLTQPGYAYAIMSSGDNAVANITIPNGTDYARFAVFQADFRRADGSPPESMQDVNIAVFDANSTFLREVETENPDEQVSLAAPLPGVYQVLISAVKVDAFTVVWLSTWIVSSQPSPDMRHPRSIMVKSGMETTIALRFAKLSFTDRSMPPVRYLARMLPSFGGVKCDATVVSIVA